MILSGVDYGLDDLLHRINLSLLIKYPQQTRLRGFLFSLNYKPHPLHHCQT